MNHASGSFRGIVSTYQKYSFEPEMRKALDRWGQYIENLPRTIIARPVDAINPAEPAGFSELIARPGAVADNRELEAA